MLLSSGPYTFQPTKLKEQKGISDAEMDTLVNRLLNHKAEQSTIDLKNDWDHFTKGLHIRMTNKIF
ncbi:MAG: hypothetical protein CMC35_02730 [Flavobacteriaceae bacterium]|mgnify:CR=1 FL=1|nr:hypothetical protein [Flavobacteriaceae bacterium]|tara:strand:+ start:662 stop:859 length:198 start_codon:yes stop_codon:yes gene_type:complete